jgi:nitrate/nitrite-specific signal transduction histidine kinase
MFNKISTKIKVIVISLSIIIATIIALTIAISEKSKKDALVVNIAGKQRMLTQRMSKEIFYLKMHESYDTILLNEIVKEFEDSLNMLIKGDSARGIAAAPTADIQKKLLEVQKLWNPFKKEIQNIQSQAKMLKALKESMLTRVEKLLNLSDDVVKQMVKHNMDGIYIDDSGRQRMLSQRMTMLLLEFIKSEKSDTMVLFQDAKKLYDTTIKSFMSDHNIDAIPQVKQTIATNYEYWEQYQRFVDELMLIEASINKSIYYIHNHNTALLNTMDEAVSLFTIYQENKNETLRMFQYFAAAFAFVVIFYVFSVIKAMQKNIQDFIEKTKQLSNTSINEESHILDAKNDYEEELQEASTHIQTYMHKVHDVMHSSEEAIKKAEDVVATLQGIADDLAKSQHFDDNISDSEDIVIESTENLLHVSNLLKKLQKNLGHIHPSS